MSKIKRPAELRYLRELLSFVVEFAGKSKMPEDALSDFRLALEEALVNIISYAYPEGGGDVQLECSVSSPGLAVKISDWGVPFNPKEVSSPDTDAPLSDRAEGGLGIFLAHSLVDDIQYSRKNGRNILAFIKHFDPS